MAKVIGNRPILWGFNGPPESGKSFIMSKMWAMLPGAVTISIQDGLFKLHQERDRDATEYESYADYKASPDYDRAGLIATAAHARENLGGEVLVRMCESLPAFQSAKVVLFDNIGLEADHDWAIRVGKPYVMIRIDTPYSKYKEPEKSLRRRRMATWEGDSRRPFTWNKMLTAYDSQQMSLLLDWLADPAIRKDGGPYHEYDEIWKRCLG